MIQIETIEIQEFRGIRKLTLSFGRKNFGICGPNGTGKSGIVDAIEFALTGDITRLGGSGTAEISVRAHAPHVDARTKPQLSFVKIAARDRATKKQVTIERRVSTPGIAVISPDNEQTRESVAKLAMHPEFALSRREIIKYVLTPAGQRSKDVQTLLRLDHIEKVRQSLQRVANDCKREASQATTEDERTKRDLMQHLGIATLSKNEFLAVVNERRQILQLEPLTNLEPATSLKEGVTTLSEKGKQKIGRATALADVAALNQHVAFAEAPELSQARANAAEILEQLKATPARLESFRRHVLIEQGLELLDDDFCPLCDTAWDVQELRAHLEAKLKNANETSQELQKLGISNQLLIDNLNEICRAIGKVTTSCAIAEPKIDPIALTRFGDASTANIGILERIASDPTFLDEALAVLTNSSWKPNADALEVIGLFKQHVEALPEPSKEDEAREFLIVAQEKYDRCRITTREKTAATKRAETATTVSDQYGVISNTALEAIYNSVQKDFTEYYRTINHDDEEKFEGKLIPSVGKLAFDVDFYGRGKFPPGAYHSEGHQDGMGLCLYLALMKCTLGDDFSFAVLDDVLMSVDSGHRREVCKLLKAEFPNTQFILTTHDPVWLQFMRTENLIQSSVSFGGWTVDSGPQVWNDGDVWKQIADDLAKNDVAGAAAALRRYLEYTARILADDLKASVEFRGNGHYELGDLMPAVARAWKALLKLAKESAVSWGQDTATIDAFEADAKAKIATSCAEQWMINKALHYNEWVNLQPKEFEAVALAFRELLSSMRCARSGCEEYFHVTLAKGAKEALRCGCGTTNLNLAIK